MRVEVVYIAYDGEKFDSLTECKEYESHAVSVMDEFKNHVLLLDVMKRPMLYPSRLDIEGTMAWFDLAYQQCLYININVELSNDLVNFINNNLGLIFPPNKVGLYRYDYDEDEWVSAD